MLRIAPTLGDVGLKGGVFFFADFDIWIVEKYRLFLLTN